MSGFDDVNNALGYLVQLSAHSIKAAEITQSARETYEAASVYMQKQLRTQQEQKQTIEEQKQIIEAQAKELEKVKEAKESIEELRPKKPRLGDREKPP